MNTISFAGIPQNSHIECEEYFPLRILFDSSIGENRFIGFYGGETNLLEVTVSRKTNLIKKLQIVTCRNYKIISSDLELPNPEGSGCAYLMNPQHNDCDTFAMSVYTNGIVINISANAASKYYAMGQVLFGIDDNNDLVSFIVAGLTPAEISHTIFELQAE